MKYYHAICFLSDSPCTVGFEADKYTTDEDNGFVEVCINLICPEYITNTVRVEVYSNDSSIPGLLASKFSLET